MGVGLSYTNNFKKLNIDNIENINRNWNELRRFRGRIDPDSYDSLAGVKLQLGFYFTDIMLEKNHSSNFYQIHTHQDVPCYPSFNYRFFYTPCLMSPRFDEESYFLHFKNVKYSHLEGNESPTNEMLLNSEYEFDIDEWVNRMKRKGYIVFDENYPNSYITTEPWDDWYEVVNIIDSVFMSKWGCYVNPERWYEKKVFGNVDNIMEMLRKEK